MLVREFRSLAIIGGRFLCCVAHLCDWWWGLALCGLWQGLSGLVLEQLLKCDKQTKLADSGQGESRTDGKPLSRVSCTKHNQTNCLRIHFRFPSHLAGMVFFWPLQQTFIIYILTLVFFTLACCTQTKVFKGNQLSWSFKTGCICNVIGLTINNTEIVRESRNPASLYNQDHGPIMHLDRQHSPVISCQILQKWRAVWVELEWVTWGNGSAHTTSPTRPSSSSSRLNAILNMAVLTLWAAIKHLEEFFPSNYICHLKPFTETGTLIHGDI